jgi:hypothetical protein
LLCPRLETGVRDVLAIMTTATSPERIVEIAVHNPSVLTDRGLHIGSSARDVRSAYPSARQLNSHYSEALVVDDTLAFRFSVGPSQPITDEAVVSDMSATRADSVRTEELCS